MFFQKLLHIRAVAPDSVVGAAESRCDQLLKAFGNQLADATCFVSTDLTTNNPDDDAGEQFVARRAGLRIHADH